MARRFLSGLFETKKANQLEATLRAVGPQIGWQTALSGQLGAWDINKAVHDGVEKVGMVYRCVDAIAQTTCRIPMVMNRMTFEQGRNGDVIDAPTISRLLNRTANSYESSIAFRYRLSVALLLSRRGAFVEMIKDRMGNVVELHLMMPGMVEPIPDPKLFVKEYQIMRGDYVIDRVEPERVCWIKLKPHPTDPYQQLTPMMSAGIAADTDWLARNFNRNFLMRDGRPAAIVSIAGKLSPADAEEIKARFNSGIDQAGRTTIVEADDLDYVDLSASPHDMQWTELIEGSKKDIQLAFGVPESVMGNAAGRTFDNADAERENFYLDTILPHCDPIAYGLDPITGSVKDDNVIAYDFSSVDVLQRMAARKREEYRNEVAAGLRTIDEYRDAASLTPFNVVGTRVLFHTSGLAFANNPNDQAALTQYRAVGADPAQGLQQADSTEAAYQGVRRGIQEAQRNTDNSVSAQAVADSNRPALYSSDDFRRIAAGNARGSQQHSGNQNMRRALQLVKSLENIETKEGIEKARKRRKEGDPAQDDKPSRKRAQRREEKAITVHPYLGMRTKMEGVIEGVLTQWDQRQEEIVASRLFHAKFREGTRHWEHKKLPKTQKCEYCKDQATKRILHAEGMAYIPVCEAHLEKGKNAAEHSTPDGSRDPSNVNGVRDIKVMNMGDDLPVVETKKLDPSYAVNAKRWAGDLEGSLETYLRKAMLREARNALTELKAMGVDKAVDIPSRSDLSDLLDGPFQEVMEIVRTAGHNQSSRLLEAIKQMDAEGASMKDIERKVRQMTGTRAPWRKQLSVNVTTSAVEAARAAVYAKAGNLYEKSWNAELDDRTRHTHRRADGQVRAANRPFTVGGFKMMQPCDPTAPVHEVANCRCWCEYTPSEKYYRVMEALDES